MSALLCARHREAELLARELAGLGRHERVLGVDLCEYGAVAGDCVAAEGAPCVRVGEVEQCKDDEKGKGGERGGHCLRSVMSTSRRVRFDKKASAEPRPSPLPSAIFIGHINLKSKSSCNRFTSFPSGTRAML